MACRGLGDPPDRFRVLCLGSEDTELQLWTDSSVEDFLGPSGDGSRLAVDGDRDGDGDSRLDRDGDGDRDSRVLVPGRGDEALRAVSSSSSSVEHGSDGRTRMGGMLRSPGPVLGTGTGDRVCVGFPVLVKVP